MLSQELIRRAGMLCMRYSIALILIWFGLSKFTPTEAHEIEGLVKSSPLISWLYGVFSQRGTSVFFGIVEVSAGVLLAARPFSARLSFVGSVLGCLTFITSVSFMFTTAGSLKEMDGIWVLAGIAGFVIKDLPMLGFCIWSAAESWEAASSKKNHIGVHTAELASDKINRQ